MSLFEKTQSFFVSVGEGAVKRKKCTTVNMSVIAVASIFVISQVSLK